MVAGCIIGAIDRKPCSSTFDTRRSLNKSLMQLGNNDAAKKVLRSQYAANLSDDVENAHPSGRGSIRDPTMPTKADPFENLDTRDEFVGHCSYLYLSFKAAYADLIKVRP